MLKLNQIVVTYYTFPAISLEKASSHSSSNSAREGSKSDQNLIKFHFELKEPKKYCSTITSCIQYEIESTNTNQQCFFRKSTVVLIVTTL